MRDLTLFVDRGVNVTLGPSMSAAGGFERLCSAPCAFDLRAGRYRFAVDNHALMKIRGPTTKLRHDLTVRRGQRIIVRYQSRRWLRVLGWVTMLAVPGGGAYLAGVGQDGSGPKDVGRIAGGAALTLVGVIGGLWMAVTTDRVTGWVAP